MCAATDFKPRHIPSADYRDHNNVNPSFRYDEGQLASPEGEASSTVEEVGPSEAEKEEKQPTGPAAAFKPRKPEGASASPIQTLKSVGRTDLSQSFPDVARRVDSASTLESEANISKAAEVELNEKEPARPSCPPEKVKAVRNHEPMHDQIYLRSVDDVFYLHSYELEESVLLTILTSGAKLSEEDQEGLWQVRKELKKELQSLLGFMAALDSTHLEAVKLNHVHQLPGLVHFMYVDRNNDRLYAPKITGLVGQSYQCAHHKEYCMTCKEYLRKQVRSILC